MIRHKLQKIGLLLSLFFYQSAFALKSDVKHTSLQEVATTASTWGSSAVRITVLFCAFAGVVFLANGFFKMKKTQNLTEELIFIFISAIGLIALTHIVGLILGYRVIF